MVSLKKIFFTFFKIGALTFGGGIAMIPIIEKEIVSKKWIDEDELLDYIALSQMAPGMIAVNIAILVGTHLHKKIGGFIACLGVVLPSFITILLIASLLHEFNDIVWIQSALRGIMMVVIILLGYALYTIGKKAILSIWLLLYAFVCFGLIFFLDIPTSIVILISMLVGSVEAWILSRRVKS